MKRKLISIITVLSLILQPLHTLGVEISFDNLDSVIQEDNSSLEADDIFILNEDNILFETDNNEEETPSYINMLAGNGESFVSGISVPENLNYTTVDITDVFTGSIISHDCNLYLISNFDEVEHWNECSVCGKIVNKEGHNYVDNGWTGGSASNCAEINVHMFSCQCGYSYSNTTGKATHKLTNSNHTTAYRLETGCSVCSDTIATIHECVKSDGSRINCSNPGKCSLCGYTYTSYHRGDTTDIHKDTYLREVYCRNCPKYLGNITTNNYSCTSDGTVKFSVAMTPPNGYTSISYLVKNWSTDSINVSSSRSGFLQNATVTFKKHIETYSIISADYDFYIDGQHALVRFFFCPYPEYTPPVITNINSNTGDWTTDTTISITGTENYCNSVNLTLKDTDGNIYAENVTVSVTSKNWNYEIKPSLEAPENTEFILQVTDILGNTTEQSFYISKIDTIPPKAIETETLNKDWSKTKNYVFTSSDYGIGQVQNSVISTDNYESATENENIFYKGYTFTGDVYGKTLVPVYMKDGLGNQNVEFISVSNLDNTPPIIENIELNKTLHNTEITILANDINEKLNLSGSGVTGYAISTENEIPDTFQESNTFNISESGKYYIFITDLVGNITSRELNIPVKYKVTINPDGGTWKGSTLPQEIETDEPINLYPEPEKEGYIFKEWEISGEGEIDEDGNLIINGDVTVTPIWEANKYSVTFIDYDVTNNRIMNTTTRELDFNTEISGTYVGSDKNDNAYYPQYRLVSDTEIIVSTNPENNIVYRYFEFCYTSKESHINFNDNDDKDGLRPETYKLQLILENGELIDEVTLPTTEPDYTFTNLPKYDEQGEEYNYKIIPIISDRYDITPNPEDESTPKITYSSPNCSIKIPKVTTLDGKNGNLDYMIQVEANLFYKDKIILIPDENVTLTDGVKNMVATITQDKTEFNKEDMTENTLSITGNIQAKRRYFAGVWHGTFNFKIKYEVKN